MATTIRDVAQPRGVSIATVSRALRDADSVTPETRARVSRAAADLEYVPSQLGRQLAQGRHAANGIVFPDLSGPYYAEVVLGYESVAAAARPLGADPLDPRPPRRRRAGDRAGRPVRRHRHPDGRTVDDEVVHRLTRRGTPVVLVARTPLARRRLRQRREQRHRVRCSASTWSPSGARTICFVGDPDASSDVAERYAGDQGRRRARRRRGRARAPSPTSARTPALAPPRTRWPAAVPDTAAARRLRLRQRRAGPRDAARPARGAACASPTTPSSPAGTT